MNMTIHCELRLLAASLAAGIGLMAVYDGLRLFRVLVPHGNFWTGMEDALYWIGSSIVTFLLLFNQNDGILRWYAVAGVLAGMLLYNLTASRILLKLLKKLEKYSTIRKKKKLRKKERKAGDAEHAGKRKDEKKEEGKSE